MNKKELLDGLKELDELSQGDYRQSLGDLVEKAPDLEAVGRLSRLIGVSLKLPFAEPVELDFPSVTSHAYRAWELIPARLDRPMNSSLWQARTLVYLWQGSAYSSWQSLAIDAHHERGFFRCLAQSVQKYICADPKFRKKIETSIKKGAASGFNVKVFTPEQLVQAGGVALASLLITHVPVLGLVGAPVIAGLVLLLYSIGIDAFCQWLKSGDASKEIDPHGPFDLPSAASGRSIGKSSGRSSAKPKSKDSPTRQPRARRRKP
jgi:hypothetical protein